MLRRASFGDQPRRVSVLKILFLPPVLPPLSVNWYEKQCIRAKNYCTDKNTKTNVLPSQMNNAVQ